MNNDITFFEVLSNVNHNGTLYQAGQVVGSDEMNVEGLVRDGILLCIEGASTREEALALAAQKDEPEAASEEAQVAPKNTWGPTEQEAPVETPAEAPKDSAEAPATAPAADIVKKAYTVVAEKGIQLEGEGDKTYAMGEVVELDPASEQTIFFVSHGAITETEAPVQADPSAAL